jgi:3-dehydroquinate synthase
MPKVTVRLSAPTQSYEIRVGPGLLTTLGAEVRGCLGPQPRRAAVISNKTVFSLYGRVATESLLGADLAFNHLLIEEGERHKSFRSLKNIIAFFTRHKLERNDVVIALGGGVIGDLAGFAAAIYLRGISFIQVPTTLLAQIDASVGGKTGINLTSGKNLVGAFHQPRLVLIDTETLRTLPQRELTSGWCEAVKQGAIGSPRLFTRTTGLLRNLGADLSLAANGKPVPPEISQAIAAHCRFKASIVSGDEHEDPARTDQRSRRILNFGHTTAHALEVITRFQRFRHGEAVGYGMVVAGEISKSLGMLPPPELELLREAVTLCGPLPRASDLSAARILKAMAGEKKSVAGQLKWVLLRRIGRPEIVDGSKINPQILAEALRAGLQSGQPRGR